jgi:hypothetical protein
VRVVLVDARHPASGTVSGGGPPPHFNKPRDNLYQPVWDVSLRESQASFGGTSGARDVPVGALRMRLRRLVWCAGFGGR